MGRTFVEHLNGRSVYQCKNCQTCFSNAEAILSTNFRAASGRAYLFNQVINYVEGKIVTKDMLTGKYFIRGITCKVCRVRIGWKYEFSKQYDNIYKEGLFVIEAFLIEEAPGLGKSQVQKRRCP